MRQVFIKWFYKFDAADKSIIKFRKGYAQPLIDQAKSSDAVIVFVGAIQPETEPEDRGRLLGMAEFESEIRKTADEIDFRKSRGSSFNARNEYRWPETLRATQVWRFLDKPLTGEILSKPLPREAAWRALEVPFADAQKILALRMEEVPLKALPAK